MPPAGGGQATAPTAPLFPNGHFLGLTRCYGHDRALNGTSDPWVISGLQDAPDSGGGGAGGWGFMTHQMHVRNPGDVPKYKPGWVSKTVGAALRFEIDTSGPPGEADPAHGPRVLIVYLQSYTHMGMAQVSCVSGCTCGGATIDAHSDERVSVNGYKELFPSRAAHCVVQLEVLAASKAPPADVRHKFKLIAVTVHA